MYFYDTNEVLNFIKDNEGKEFNIHSIKSEHQLFPVYKILHGDNYLSCAKEDSQCQKSDQ